MTRATRLLAAALIVMAATACAPAGEDAVVESDDVPTSSLAGPASSTTAGETPAGTTGATAGDSQTTTMPESESAPDPDRPVAPDVSLELADGSTFVLSEEDQPVFLVFWAEW